MNTPSATTKSAHQTISCMEVLPKRSEVLFLDVRTPAEFEEAHIPGSVLRPLQNLDPAEIVKMAEGKEGCVLICRSGNRATDAARKLSAAGVGGLLVLQGGIQAWGSAGQELNRGRKTVSLERQVRIAAGALVLTGALLGALVHPAWIALSGFVGAGLMFAGITDTCGMAMMLARMPWNNRGASCRTDS